MSVLFWKKKKTNGYHVRKLKETTFESNITDEEEE
jgi:hypothetical protein